MAKTIYIGDNIITMAPTQSVNAVLVENDKIIAVGSKQDLLSLCDTKTEKVELGKRALLPAFIDAHSHFTAVAVNFIKSSLDSCTSFDDIAKQLKDFIQINNIKRGEWVQGQGYDHNRLKEHEHPTKQLLDKILPDNPVIISHQSGHMGVLNSKALKLLNIESNSGYFEEGMYMSILNKIPMPTPKELDSAYDKAQKLYAQNGITTVQEGMLNSQMAPLLQSYKSKLYLDLIAYIDIRDLKAIDLFKSAINKFDGRIKIGGFKLFLDGSPQGKTAWMLDDYLSQPGYHGKPEHTDDEVIAAINTAKQYNMQIITHCNGDAAARQLLICLEKASFPKSLRPVMIHAQFLRPEDMPRVKRLGVIPSFFIAHILYWGDTHIKNFGLERASQISPAASAEKFDIPFTFHQDSPVIKPDMLETVACAVNRITKSGAVLGKDQRISVFSALKAVTINSAFQYFEQNKLGSIEPGKSADLVILSSNPITNSTSLENIEVLSTIKDGKIIFTR